MTDDLEKKLNLNELLNLISFDLSRLCLERDTSAWLDYDFEIKPSEFITYAELDLQENTNHGLVNALSNAKRAIDCQVDSVLGCFGLLSRRNFPQKIETLSKMGIITPRIVSKVIKARNYLEHEFKQPEREQVEDAVDIATLFCRALDYELHNFNDNFAIGTSIKESSSYEDIWIGVDMDKWMKVRFDNDETVFKLDGLISEAPTPDYPKGFRLVSVIIKPYEPEYIDLIKIASLLNRPVTRGEITQQLALFIQAFSTSAK